eukprot:m.472121 g.472121  ORF g.472121 m.472121 type:complete len:312 (-) comp21660_c0_seq12:1282-2217(-)
MKGLVVFYTTHTATETNHVLGRLANKDLPNLEVAVVYCDDHAAVCQRNPHVTSIPHVSLHKHIGCEDYSNPITSAHAVAAWAQEGVRTNVVSLTDKDFPKVLVPMKTAWFVDFALPGCAPCEAFLPTFREASVEAARADEKLKRVRFGTVNCQVFSRLCGEHGAHSFPYPVFYNFSNGEPHPFDANFGGMTSAQLTQHMQEVFHPVLTEISPSDWERVVIQSKQVWMVDFSAGPWCGPCTDALRELKTVARQIGNMARIGYCVVVAVCDVCCVLSTGWRDSLSAFLKVKLFFASGGGVLVAPLICSCQHIL